MRNDATKPLRKRERAFFAAADFYGGGGMALIGVLYFVFLTDIIALNPILAGAVVLISEIWDAISDPLMGVIGDNTRTRLGRRKPYIILGGCLLAVAFSLIFMPIKGWGQGWKFVYAAATYLLYNTVSTVINVSYSSMSAEISADSAERDKANVLRLVVSTASAALCTILPSLVIEAYNNEKISLTVFYLIVGIGFGILFALPVILCGIFVQERVELPEEMARFKPTDLIEPLKSRPFRHLVGMYLCQALCMDVFSTGVVMFAKYVTVPKGSSTVFLGIFIAVQLIAFPIVNKLIKTYDINRIYGFGLPLSVLAMIAFGIFGANLYVAYGCVFFVALGFAGAQLTSWIMFPHAVDAGELLTGKRQSGSCSATMTFARKSSSALVIFVFSLVLEFTGYKEELDVQPIGAQNGIKYAIAATCIIFMALGFFVARKYALSHKRNEQVSKYLSLRREGGLDGISDEEKAELEDLISVIS